MTKFEQARKEMLIKQSFEYIKQIESILSRIDACLQKRAA